MALIFYSTQPGAGLFRCGEGLAYLDPHQDPQELGRTNIADRHFPKAGQHVLLEDSLDLRELAAFVAAWPGVGEVAVVALTHPIWGQVPGVAVTGEIDDDAAPALLHATQQALIAYAADVIDVTA